MRLIIFLNIYLIIMAKSTISYINGNKMHYAENESAMPIRLHCNDIDIGSMTTDYGWPLLDLVGPVAGAVGGVKQCARGTGVVVGRAVAAVVVPLAVGRVRKQAVWRRTRD